MWTQEQLKTLIKRRHPDYKATLEHWNFLEACYRGGREWFEGNIFKYLREGEDEYRDRVARAYRFNHSREIVDLVNKYVFKGKIDRNVGDAPELVKRFWENATLSGLPIDQFMRQVSTAASIYGRIWIVVDNNATEQVLSVAEEKKLGARCYAYIVNPQHALDMSYDDNGNLNWILIYELARDDDDPFHSSGEMKDRYRLWTRDKWYLFEEQIEGRKKIVALIDEGHHGLGEVPVFKHDHINTDHPYVAPSLINDIAYLDRAVANYLSNLDAIIQDQTFSQLTMPAQNVTPGSDTHKQLIEMGTKRIFVYDGEGGARPEYISPDPKQAGVIVSVIRQIINEIYHTVGMAGERTKQDNSMGIDNSSGVAKAYDFERVNALLAAKADSLDLCERNLIRLVNLWSGNKDATPDLVKYPDDFDVRGLYDEFEIADKLMLIDAPETMRKEQMKLVVEKLWPRLRQDLKKKMFDEIDAKWPPKPEAVSPDSILERASQVQGQPGAN